MPPPLDAVPHLPYFRATLIVLALTLVGYFAVPSAYLWVIAAVASAVLLAIGKWMKRVHFRTIALRGAAWSVFPFVIGMFVVIHNVEKLGSARSLAVCFQHSAAVLSVARYSSLHSGRVSGRIWSTISRYVCSL